MKKVYSVVRKWTNGDGWEISSPRTVKTFVREEDARNFIFQQTGLEAALKYGYASVAIPSGHQVWLVITLDVE